MPFLPGELVAAKYEVIELIGAGAMGYVVSAKRIELGDKVAMKFLRPELVNHHQLVTGFVREARLAVMIQSEHVVRIFDVGNLPEHGPFIAMEFLEGHDLGRLVERNGPLPLSLAVEYALQACEALATAHASGIVHRDVKPENLFLTRPAQGMDVVKVLDFGISKGVLSDVELERKRPFIRTMSTAGSPPYMSPEQLRGFADIDGRCDVWGLGCVLYELLTGVRAFDANSLTELTAKILEQEPAPIGSWHTDIPPALEAVVMRCLEKERERRFADMGELAVALCRFAAERTHIWAERSCYVLRAAASLPPAERASVERTPSLQAAVYDLTVRRPSTLPPADADPAPSGAKAGARRFFRSSQRIWLALGMTAVAGAYMFLRLPRPRVDSTVLVTTSSPALDGPTHPLLPAAGPPSASLHVVAPHGVSPARPSGTSRAAGPASRGKPRPRSAPLVPPEPSEVRDTVEPALRAPTVQPENKKRAPLVGEDWRAALVE